MIPSLDSHPERGAALLYVMLIFVIASVIAAGLLSRERIEVIRTGIFLDRQQAIHYAYGAEAYARQLLYDDMVTHSAADYVAESWGGKLDAFPIPEGRVEMRVEDLLGRFNINSLLAGDQTAGGYFLALCTNAGIRDNVAHAVLLRLAGINPPETHPGTASIPPRWLADASELIDYGLPREDYRKLEPYLITLPEKTYEININTASDVLLIAYLGKNAPLDTIRNAIKANGYISLEEFGPLGIHGTGVGVTSHYFRVHTAITLNGRTTRLHSTLYRHAGTNQPGIVTVARSWGE